MTSVILSRACECCAAEEEVFKFCQCDCHVATEKSVCDCGCCVDGTKESCQCDCHVASEKSVCDCGIVHDTFHQAACKVCHDGCDHENGHCRVCSSSKSSCVRCEMKKCTQCTSDCDGQCPCCINTATCLCDSCSEFPVCKCKNECTCYTFYMNEPGRCLGIIRTQMKCPSDCTCKTCESLCRCDNCYYLNSRIHDECLKCASIYCDGFCPCGKCGKRECYVIPCSICGKCDCPRIGDCLVCPPDCTCYRHEMSQ